MAPGYRTATTTRRGNRSGYAELDDYEGLPVRQWRLQEVDIAPPPVQTTAQKNDRWSIELPHGMPKDYHLLPAHSQDLLRAARSGALYKRKAPPEEEDSIDVLDKGLVTDADKAGDKKTSAGKADAGIKVKVWKRVAREIEVPSHSYLAKRHKNTITLPSKASATQFSGPTVTRVTVRRIDAAGNAYERTITINDDEQMKHLDGEIVSTTVIAAPVAADPVAQQQPTPTRKRPPPPPHKKKHKGPGRGRKKKLGFVSLPLPAKPGASANPADAAAGATEPKTEASAGADGIKREESTGTPDVEMGENSVVASDDEEGDDDEGEEGEEGDGNEGQADDTMADATEQGTPADRQDQEMGHADESADVIRPSSIEEPAESSQGAEAETETYNAQTSVPLGTPHLGVGHLFSAKQHEGSPLKNVVLQSPTEPKSMDFPSISSIQETSTVISDAQPAPGASTTVTETAQQKTETAAAGLAMVEMSAQTTTITSEAPAAEPTEGKSSLPDLRSPPATSASKDEVIEVTHETTGDKQAKTQVTAHSASQQSHQASSTSSLLPSLREPPKSSAPPPTASPPMMQSRPVQEDDGLDLLGGLERELDRQSRTNTNAPAEQAAQAPATGDKAPMEEKANDQV
ncbi:hypothetical protein GE09DRAFT_1130724 [Coniochaeta sp. 2T2.1]|nr:hypothetical protein GE09DRAFT_1130724 [Coniochaeta sp. 2T2.1]